MDTHDIMTIKEVSEYLRVSERTVLDWAQKGEIPCGKLGSSWRFKSDEIKKWLDDRLSSAPPTAYPRIKLEMILNPNSIQVVKESLTKENVLNSMVDNISDVFELKNREEFRTAIFHREELMSTGIGLGIAVPHVRLKNIEHISMGAMLVKQGVDDYDALDGQPVKLIFMIIANEAQHVDYLKFLSALSKQLQCEEYRQELLEVADSDNFYMKLIRGI
ncbi:MAG: PTS sugar transporter subunit IIA [Lentisphaerales bacterium]|nr:PTS sugar transporter subunit IIA [Lentisphaerales bacterium]